ncbi:MAG: hypothetical protein KR126chlam6_00184 [Candidatus Anoxychlamydiales bacterium]|nr:hypothetical protein [Candidatus Anoxychlamydiales bacterium]
MQNKLHILIHRLKDQKDEKIVDKILFEELDIENEKELIFLDPIQIDGKAYLASETLIINLNITFTISMPCIICEKFIKQEIEIKNLYITEELTNIKTYFDMKDEIRNATLVQIPSFVECMKSCPERQNAKKYFKKEAKRNFPFSNLKE